MKGSDFLDKKIVFYYTSEMCEKSTGHHYLLPSV